MSTLLNLIYDNSVCTAIARLCKPPQEWKLNAKVSSIIHTQKARLRKRVWTDMTSRWNSVSFYSVCKLGWAWHRKKYLHCLESQLQKSRASTVLAVPWFLKDFMAKMYLEKAKFSGLKPSLGQSPWVPNFWVWLLQTWVPDQAKTMKLRSQDWSLDPRPVLSTTTLLIVSDKCRLKL